MEKEKQKGPSFRAKRKKLNNEIMSRDFDLYFQVNISQINATIRFWLIIFTKPRLDVKALKSRDEWSIRFWIWDSLEGKIAGENVLQYPESKRIMNVNPVNPKLMECYVDEEHQRLVMRPRSEKGYFIFSYPDGVLLHHTRGNWSPNNDLAHFSSRFVDNNLFFCSQDGIDKLYILSQLIPKEIELDFGHGIVKIHSSTQFFYEGVDDMKWFIFTGYHTSMNGFTISVYKRLDRGDPDEIYMNLGANLYFPLENGADHIDVKKEENALAITIFPKSNREGVISTTLTDLI